MSAVPDHRDPPSARPGGRAWEGARGQLRGDPRNHIGGAARPRAAWVAALQAVPTSSILLALIAALCVFGVVMVGSASEAISIQTYGSPWAIVVRECLWLAVGTVALCFAVRFDYRKWRRLSAPLLVCTFVLLVAYWPRGGHPRRGLEPLARASARWSSSPPS